MSTAVEHVGLGLTRRVTPEERDDLITRAFAAFDRGDDEVGYSYLAQVPLIPSLARFAFERRGREYCLTRFNLADADAEFGQGWMDE